MMRLTGNGRKLAALAGLAVLAALGWYTMDPGKVRLLVMVLLGGFAARIALSARTAQGDDETGESRQSLQ